ncbi:glutathione S-transferase [Hoeflea marina]|uniref:Glutathione S-transferase n=1 Tax=Hoeflea marina TaxID=274592 RepID=A0A317PK61_9HYPH|nr:glutathione S-transferase family protein [Hoeflea marina]PWV98969.1 glutathione S-transferase [Hoeflea marina]
MILIGQYDSSFTRRIAIAMKLYGIAFEHRPWSVFSDADRLRKVNPLVRVPTLVLDDGEVLIDSHSIIDFLDRLAPAGKAMFPAAEPERHRAMKVAALATGVADKAVALFYEIHMHQQPSTSLMARLTMQIHGALAALESSRAEADGDYWFGDAIGHADIAVACAFRHLTEALPDVVGAGEYPAIRAHCARLEAMDVFKENSQAFIPPK